jgi:hypothetical protein
MKSDLPVLPALVPEIRIHCAFTLGTLSAWRGRG